ARRLDAQFGVHSRFARLLSPDDREGFLGRMRETIERDVERQRTALLEEFRVEKEGSALQRLLNHVAQKNGELREDLAGEVEKLSAEFDFKNEASAISAMKRTLDATQEAIAKDLSLDAENSALARLQKTLFEQLEQQRRSSTDFQQEIREAVAKLQTAKQERERSTTHGLDFEDAVADAIDAIASPAGAAVDRVGETTGLVKNRKVGDVVVTLGADHAAAGAKVVFEAKAEAGKRLADMLSELDLARRNRDADVGVFVYSSRHAAEGAEPFARHGQDLVVHWDHEDADTDWRLHAAVSVATALCTRRAAEAARVTVDFAATDKAVNAIVKQAERLDEINTWGGNIKRDSDKILDRVRIAREDLTRQLAVLQDQVAEMKESFAGSQT
ncbi:MAG: hypothetical protein AAGJ97_08785, partial [Planctomycetota bacterium]